MYESELRLVRLLRLVEQPDLQEANCGVEAKVDDAELDPDCAGQYPYARDNY